MLKYVAVGLMGLSHLKGDFVHAVKLSVCSVPNIGQPSCGLAILFF